MLGVGSRSVWRWRDNGFCPRPVRLGKNVRMPADVLAQWVDAGTPDCRKIGWVQERKIPKKNPRPVSGCHRHYWNDLYPPLPPP